MKRVLVISDLHCGHSTGLTPPEFSPQPTSGEPREELHALFRSKLWSWFASTIDSLRPFDALIVNGDAIDGKGERSGGTELVTADRTIQIKMARAAIALCDVAPSRTFIIGGTPYHVGRDDNFELSLADQIGAHYGRHEWITVDGVVIDVRHKIGTSQVPYSRANAISRSRLWNQLWALRGQQPEADILIRSHAHYYTYAGDARGVAIVTPALEGWTNFGSLEMDGTNDIGFLTIDVAEGGYSWTPHLMNMQWAAVNPHRV